MSEALAGPVEVVGAGLLGTSIGLACRRAGLEVLLTDTAEENVRTASGLGAGRARVEGDRPQLVVVAVPPDHLGAAVVRALGAADAVVTDVGSVKSEPLRAVADAAGLERYVGSHPMAGSERSGPLAASAALFDGRPWAVTPHETSDPGATDLVEELARLCGAVPVRLTPEEHDHAVARTSHLPHLLAVLVAGRLADAPAEHLALSGQGVRDVTRVAGGDPALWQQIVTGNAEAVRGLLAEVREELDVLIRAVASGDGRPGRPARARRRRHPGDPRQARRARPADPVGVRLGARPSRASSRGSSPTPAPAGSTSRTCTSTTTRAAPSAWSSSSSTRPAPSTCWSRWNLGNG